MEDLFFAYLLSVYTTINVTQACFPNRSHRRCVIKVNEYNQMLFPVNEVATLSVLSETTDG